jgi:CelD/BcsL family acetyltransferase involved in cellulose biosynthesis
MRLEVISDTAHFQTIQQDWDRLLSTSNSPALPLSHDWFCAWWQVFGVGKQLYIVCVYDNDQLVAIAPFMREKASYRRVPVTIQKFMANGHSPFCDVILPEDLSAGKKAEVLDLIIQNNSADILQFNKIPENGIIANHVRRSDKCRYYRYGIKPSLVTPIIRIQGDWEKFIQEKSRKFRKSLNNKLNKFNKSAAYTIDCVQIPDDQHPYLTKMVEISKNSWKRKIKNDLGSNIAGREFLFKLAARLGPKGMLHIWMMHKGEQPVAFEYHLGFHGVVYPVRADYDDGHRMISPGSVLEYTALKSLFENQDAQEYYSCADDYWYLSNWTNEMHKHITIEIFADSWKASILHILEYVLIPKLRILRDKIYKRAT